MKHIDEYIFEKELEIDDIVCENFLGKIIGFFKKINSKILKVIKDKTLKNKINIKNDKLVKKQKQSLSFEEINNIKELKNIIKDKNLGFPEFNKILPKYKSFINNDGDELKPKFNLFFYKEYNTILYAGIIGVDDKKVLMDNALTLFYIETSSIIENKNDIMRIMLNDLQNSYINKYDFIAIKPITPLVKSEIVKLGFKKQAQTEIYSYKIK